MSATVADNKQSPEATEALEPAPRKRGRPKGAKNKPKEPAGTAASYYGRPFPGRVKFLLGIKVHSSGLSYAHHVQVAGLQFQQTTQRPYGHAEDDGVWQRLGTPGKFGSIQQLTYAQIERFTDRLSHYVVKGRYEGATIQVDAETGRPTNQAAAFNFCDLSATVGSVDPRTGESRDGAPIHRLGPHDIPAAECLIVMRVSDAKDLNRSDRALPSVATLDPALGKIPDIYGAQIPESADHDEDDYGDW